MRKILLLLLIPFFADAQIGYTPYPNKSWFKDTVQFSKAMRLNFGGFGTGKVLTSDAEGRVHWDTGGGTVDTLTLPFYHSITGITDTSLSWNKLTGVKDTVEFHIQGYPISNNFWSLTGNAGTNYVTNFIGTTDEQPLILKANNGGYPVAVFTNNSFSVADSANDVDKFIVDVENSQSEFKTSLRIKDGTEGAGKVFTSDSAGYGSWQYDTVGSGLYLPLAGGTMDSGSHIYFGTGTQNISQGTFDNSTGGNKGISLNCAVGYELNWQGGHLSSSYNNGNNFNALIVDTALLINGTIQITDGTQGSGKVLTSNAYGLASWQTLALTDTATLNFGSISANGHEVLTMTVTGAALSDVVSLGIPNASMNDHASFVAWVSSSNTVSVKCFNFDGSNFNPAAGLFTLKVFK